MEGGGGMGKRESGGLGERGGERKGVGGGEGGQGRGKSVSSVPAFPHIIFIHTSIYG